MAVSTNFLTSFRDACNWSTSLEIVDAIRLNNLNVTDIVKECQGVCSVVFGPSSPPSVSPSLLAIQFKLTSIAEIRRDWGMCYSIISNS